MLNNGAIFCDSRRHRFALWRIWDEDKPLAMFIGLNPSTANEATDDNTIKKVCKIANHNGFGGVYMMNCFPFVTKEPSEIELDWDFISINDRHLEEIGKKCKAIIFAWGNFKIVRDHGRDEKMKKLFPESMALHINKNGSPKHPLYCNDKQIPVNYQ